MIDFSYQLISDGWAEIFLVSEDVEVKLSVSYLSDALRDLLIAVSVLLEGTSTSKCALQDEPGECRFLFSMQNDNLNLLVIRLDDNFSRKSDSNGEKLFQGSDKLLRFARKMVSQTEQILNEHHIDGYNLIWAKNEFPIQEFNRLKTAIKIFKILQIETRLDM